MLTPVQRYCCTLAILAPLTVGADQVTLANGDTITAVIVKKDGDKLTVKSDVLGELAIPWSAIASMRSDQPVYVTDAHGRELSGRVSTAGKELTVESGAISQAVPLANVAGMRDEAEELKYRRLLHPGWTELWASYFDLGFAIARGNARTEVLTTAFNAVRATRADKTTLHFNQIYSTAEINRINATTAQAIRGGLSYDRNLGTRTFLNALNNYEFDEFQNLDLRFVAGGGVGVHAINRERTKLDLLGGGDYMRESFSNNIQRNSAEAYFGDEFAYSASTMMALTQSLRISPNLSRAGEYRLNADIGTATTLRKWLSWHVTASDRYLSNPVFGRQRNDLLLTTGFRMSFAR